jgi:hypothetical protein
MVRALIPLKSKWKWKFDLDISREQNSNIFNIELPSIKTYSSNDIAAFTSYISSDIVVRSIFIVNLNSFFRHSDNDWFLPSRTCTYPRQYFFYHRNRTRYLKINKNTQCNNFRWIFVISKTLLGMHKNETLQQHVIYRKDQY